MLSSSVHARRYGVEPGAGLGAGNVFRTTGTHTVAGTASTFFNGRSSASRTPRRRWISARRRSTKPLASSDNDWLKRVISLVEIPSVLTQARQHALHLPLDIGRRMGRHDHVEAHLISGKTDRTRTNRSRARLISKDRRITGERHMNRDNLLRVQIPGLSARIHIEPLRPPSRGLIVACSTSTASGKIANCMARLATYSAGFALATYDRSALSTCFLNCSVIFALPR